MTRLVRVFMAALVFAAGAANAAEPAPAEALKQTLAQTTTMAGNFEQTVTGESGELIEQSSGEFVLSRPGRFYWHTTEPFPQKLISDGQTLWLYDPDLLQVTIRPVSDRQKRTPAMLLSDSADTLSEHFHISRPAEGGGERYRLTPKGDDSLFEQLELIFAGERLTRIVLLDSLGQRTVFELDVQQRNQPVDDAVFHFTVPDGVDVLRD